ncbi:DUF2157 domain-containing protein [Eleftheria terrae]|uniref:DUF2157 domain-containing protein n=1 Tax=Eleftheria terrae TaxID=1597781 RepID=UPI00263BA6FB|nr:DUF2157 domain-containing protein [Eleftheria terrae]WKB50609.1 DUF2157 domain-containing protein [Eleftheria terrae]
MNLRLALYELAERHHLDARSSQRLQQLAGLHEEPAGVSRWMPLATAVLAAVLGGLGLVFWVAANWQDFGRAGRFLLLQAFVVLPLLGALWKPAARAPLALLSLLGIGALFAYFGQTYQTGADPWQLFGLWAALALPLCLALRSDVLWAPWALVSVTAASLWVHAHIGHRWSTEPQDLGLHAVGWGWALAVVAGLSPPLQRYSGAGPWALRTAVTLAVAMITTTGIIGVFRDTVAPHYLLALLLLLAAGVALAQARSFDIFGLSATALGLNTLLFAGLVRLLFRHHRGDAIGELLILGLTAAGLLAATVQVVLKLARQHAQRGGRP